MPAISTGVGQVANRDIHTSYAVWIIYNGIGVTIFHRDLWNAFVHMYVFLMYNR